MTSGILKAVSNQTGLTYDKKRNIVYGSFKGFLVSVKELERLITVTVSAKQQNPEQNQSTKDFMCDLKARIPQIKQTMTTEYSMQAVIKIGIYKKAIGVVLNTLSQMSDFCFGSRMITCCSNCGNENNLDVVSVNENPNVLCDVCTQAVIEDIDNAKANVKNKKGNFIGGLVGAFLGSLIGVVVWVVIYQLGYIAAISGLAFAICSIKGFEKFSGKLNIAGLISSLIIAVVMLYFAQNISLGLEIYQAAIKEGYNITFFDAYRAIGDFMQSAEVSRSFWSDLAVGYLMMAVASISPVIHLFKTSNIMVEVTKLGQKDNQPTL